SLISVSVINTSVITVGDTITIQAKMSNPDGVKFTSVVINGKSYDASSISTSTSLYVDVVVDDLIDGGTTDFTISSVTGTIGGSTYTIYVEEGNTASAFVYGDIIINDFSLTRFTNEGAEETRYRFLDEQIYFAVSLRNGTGYEVYSVTIDKTTYSGDSVTMSDDMQTAYVAANSVSSTGWSKANITGITYGSENYGERSLASDITVEYMTLKDSSNVYEIYTAEDLMNTDFTGYSYYKLMSDIDLSGKEILNLGDLVGVFDGNGYTISNVRAVKNVADEDLYLGLFKEVTGVIMNLDLCDVLYMVTLTSSSNKTYSVYAGALAATTDHMIAENCYVTSSFQITNETGGSVYIGALCGYGSTSSSSNRFFYNVIAEMSASVSCGSCDFTGFVGRSVNYYEFDSTCGANMDIPDDGIDYIVTGGYKFSHEDGEYLLVAYYGSETNITLPETIEGNSYGIGYRAFYQSSVESVVIPDTVTSIGEYAFYGCTHLTSVSIGSDVVSIGYQAFYNCTALTKIYYNATSVSDLSSRNFVFYDAGQKSSGIEVTISSSVTKIPAYLFYPYSGSSNAPAIVSVIFEENSQCESIGKYAFAYCSKIESVSIPSSVILIDSNAFEGCSSLKSLAIGTGVATMGTRAFYDCTRLTEIYFNAVAMENLSSSSYVFYNAGQNDSGITFIIGKDSTRIPAYIFYPYNSSTASNITKVIFEENSQCGYIGSNAFNGCASLTGVYITDIAAWCMIDFENASSNPLYYAGELYLNNQLVTDLTIPDCVESIGDYVFYGCMSLTSVTIGSVTTLIGSYAFSDCVSLISILIPDGVASIGSYAFYKCTSLTTITIPDSVTSIGDHAFYGCSSLTTLVIGKGVVTIGTYAFYNCTALTLIYFNAVAMDGLSSSNHVFSYAGQSGSGITFIIGSSVTEIPAYLFYPYSSSSYNPLITTIIFEENSQCTRIDNNAFNNCYSITYVYYSGTASDWSNISIGSSNSYLTSATRYYYSETEPAEDGNYWHYVDGEIVVWTRKN
ncbi:MAG: leucine-rich repeat domain-containing protein, partial [Bacteroidales bacterium]|nr:leucine-rich repeat domain-containing protein [Bacteroidales bacterium]